MSVLLVTHNHEKYIRTALRSLFGQVAAGPIELVVADDGSADGTLDIVKEFDGSDPRFHFKYLDAASNIGITKNYQRGFAACSGSYVAVLEGDDYWTSSSKLQRQMEFLESHWECNLCSVNYFVYDEERAEFAARTAIGSGHRLFSARDLILDNVVGTFSTCMYRKEALGELPASIFEVPTYDWIVNICVSRDSLIGFLQEPMSVYRVHGDGAWSSIPTIRKLKVQLGMIPKYNEFTNRVFEPEFAILARRLRKAIVVSRLAEFTRRIKRWFAGSVNRRSLT